MAKHFFRLECTWLLLTPLLVFSQAQTGSYQTISPAAFHKQLSRPQALLLDVRTPEEFSRGHLPGAVNLNFYDPDFRTKLKAMVKDQAVLVYCAVGGRSAKAAQMLQDLRIPQVYNLDGGYTAWTRAGLPVKK
jgi:rhodanese-related sulfurtransferase